ncbi:EAL domain-containing protein [Piscinibacter sakaiensis]|uniref:Diguanylate cyclase/phosphodiesterase with PAS/PAC sensor(S) n=1 Tax=Piscinibacter sakaiensis TaxID=1547922 RepID=A0A0K8P3E6_PISS1|nr:EAL domain-containing protein [Piscinibacter sakaiensis]GAP36710.1 diguanylate cyclase/phosphodiesterase with PAS/PAC sensor(s) [Piscinibacter sakaiensis]
MTPLGHRVTGWFNASLGARIITVVLALLLLLQVTSFGFIRATLQENELRKLPDQLGKGDAVLRSLLKQQSAQLQESGRTLVSDWGFREALSTADSETIASMLENHVARLGATEALLLDVDFSVKVRTGSAADAFVPLLPALRQRAATAQDRDASHVVLVGDQLHHLVMVPVLKPVLSAWVVMGVPLQKRLIDDMRELSVPQVTLLSRAHPQAPWRVALSSLPTDKAEALSQQTWEPDNTRPGGMSEVRASGERLGVRRHWLAAPSEAPGGQGSSVLALLTSSIDDAARVPTELQWALLLITLIGSAAFGVASILTARRVTTPLHDLASAAERLGEGDLSTPVPAVGGTREVAELATTFERMRVSVADKQAEVEKLAYWDALTGLPNRVQFANAVGEAIAEAQAQGHGVAVLMLDLDRFKHVNDVLGYRLGDLLLTCVADRLKGHVVRGSDLVARLSGDEFGVLLRRGDAALVKALSQRVQRVFEQPLELEEHTVDMGAGIGMACWPEHALDTEQLLSRAEVAMYTAKRRAAGPLLYDPSIDAASAQTLSLLSELRHAVDHGELRLFLQPKLALANGSVVGAETLVRWQHPLRGMVPPMQFIPFAEQTGFIRNLTVWIFEEAARHWTRLQSEGITLTLSVNLSTRDLLDQELPQKFALMLARHCVPATAFCLEITESAIMDDPQRALLTLDRLHAQGFSLSIDDFGTGYSSLAYLKRLPVDELKIDKSFVMGMENDQDDRKIVRSTIDLAHNLGLSVVAEGVENAQIWDLLRELNCDHAQGYHMGRPMPASDFRAWAEQWDARQAALQAPGTRGAAVATLH